MDRQIRKRRSEVVTIRLDPRLKYLAELGARRQRRPLSSYIEWAVEESLRQVTIGTDINSGYSGSPETVADMAAVLWDVDDADRFVKLALRYPDLLNHEEHRLWKLIRENGLVWKGKFIGPEDEWTWQIKEECLARENLRKYWDTFKKVAEGELDEAALPIWQRKKTSSSDLNDEIPF